MFFVPDSQEHSSAIFGTRSLSRTNNTKWCRAYSFLDPIDLGICLLSPNFVLSYVISIYKANKKGHLVVKCHFKGFCSGGWIGT